MGGFLLSLSFCLVECASDVVDYEHDAFPLCMLLQQIIRERDASRPFWQVNFLENERFSESNEF